MLFLPNQQDLDCINDSGDILGKIRFDVSKDEHVFDPADASVAISDLDGASIAQRLAGLELGQYSMPMQDDD